MSNLVVIDSDWHAHLWSAFAKPLPAGINTRLVDNLNARRQVREYMIKHKIKARVTNGDEFHTPGLTGTLDVSVHQAVIREEAEFANAGIYTIKNIGNHDESVRSGEANALVGMSNQYTTVVDAPHVALRFERVFDLENVWFHMVRFDREPGTVIESLKAVTRSRRSYVFIHFEMDGLAVETGIKVKSPLKVEHLPEAKRVFFGHHHTRQVFKKYEVIGSPMQHTWSDAGQEKGFLVLNTDTGDVTLVPLDMPKFIDVDYTRTRKIPKDHHFYRIRNVPQEEAALLRRHGVIVEAKPAESKAVKRLDVSVTDLAGAVRKVIKSRAVEMEVDPDELEAYSLEVLEKCMAGEPGESNAE